MDESKCAACGPDRCDVPDDVPCRQILLMHTPDPIPLQLSDTVSVLADQPAVPLIPRRFVLYRREADGEPMVTLTTTSTHGCTRTINRSHADLAALATAGEW